MNAAQVEYYFITHYPAGPIRLFATKLLNEVSCAVQEEAFIMKIADQCGIEPEDRERVINRAIDCKLIKPELLEFHRKGRTHYIPCLVGVP